LAYFRTFNLATVGNTKPLNVKGVVDEPIF